MIRVSVELPEGNRYRLKPAVDRAAELAAAGFLLDFDLPRPDLRIIRQDQAVQELREGGLRTPVIVYERVDSAVIGGNPDVRASMKHPDVRLWLKRNAYADHRLHNEPQVTGRRHYRVLNDIPSFRDPSVTEREVLMPVTAEMAAKIRMLPIVPIDRFTAWREAKVDVSVKRPIDVGFAGMVDYEVRGSDFWDGAYPKALAETATGAEAIGDRHRRAAVLQLAALRHLRVLIGMNRALQPDIYHTVMLRTSISVSPWGLGEYAYRDYESILAGCALVKPRSDHIVTFSPGIYRDSEYYFACEPDFSDLPALIERLLGDRAATLAVAGRARHEVLAANAPARIARHFQSIFEEATGVRAKAPEVGPLATAGAETLLSLSHTPPRTARARLRPGSGLVGRLGSAPTQVLREDATARSTHDLRLVTQEPLLPGLYRMRAVVRPMQRSSVVLQLHENWRDSLVMEVDLAAATARFAETKGDTFTPLEEARCIELDDRWVLAAGVVRVSRLVPENTFIVLFPATGEGVRYDGNEDDAVEIAAFDLRRLDPLRL